MKKLLIMIVFVFLAQIAHSQEISLGEIFTFWDLELTVIEQPDNELVIVEDRVSIDKNDAGNMLYTILYSIVDEMEYEGLSVANVKFGSLLYSVIVEDDRYEIHLDKDWIVRNFEGLKDREKMQSVQTLISK